MMKTRFTIEERISIGSETDFNKKKDISFFLKE